MIKKIISRILTVTLLASCITFSGHKSVAEAEELETTLSNSQIVEPGGENRVDSDKVTTSKTIVETGVENEFEITLQVTTEEDIKNIGLSPDAATVLVLDRSGSMLEKDSDNITRFKEMQDAANDFLERYSQVEAGSNAKRLVSIVSFASNVKNETYSNRQNNWIDVTKDLTGAQTKINNIVKPIEDPSDQRRGTNIEGALIMANNIMKNGKANNLLNGNDGKEIKNINIILLTDGSPTFYAKSSDKDSIIEIDGIRGGGDRSYTTDWKPVGGTVDGVQANANNISKTIKDSGTNLYTIAFSTAEARFYTTDPSNGNNGRYINLNPSTWMSTFATRNFSASNSNELIKQFEKINKLIALSAQAWKVTDPMGENIIYNGISEFDSENAKSFNSSNNTLIWDLKNSSPVESITEGGNKKYTYTLKYKVALDTTDISKGVNYYKSVATNGETILDYYLFSKQGEDESLELKHANFKIPKVRGLFGNLEFTKVNEKKQPMSEVLFTLDGIATGSNKPVTRNIASDENGKIILSNIPAGIYTLTETSPSGYIGAGPWNVVVSYGNTTKDATLGDTIINYPASRNINVEKKWSGLPEGKPDLPEGVTVRLYKNSVETDKSLVLNKSNDWKGTFTNLPYIDENGVITYSVKEDKISGYETAIEEDKNGDKFIIINSYNPETMEIDGVKTWVDESGNGIEEEVPDILITLQRTTADNWDDESKIEDVQSITLKSGETEYNFENLPKTDTNSKEYKYRVRESKVDGYEAKYNDKFDIINTYSPGETELTVNKVWNNVNVENDVLPEVTAVLYQGDKVFRTEVLNKVNGYRYTFTNLPKYAKTGAEYKYTVKENMKEGVVGYISEEAVNEDGSVTITNTFNNEKISITGSKVWEGIPENSVVPAVKLCLYQNGVELTDKAITLNSGVKESETYSFENLPKYSTDGKEYVYTVKEDTVNGYIYSGEGNIENDYVITNTFIPETITVMGQKTWSGVEDLNAVPTITINLESSLDGETWTKISDKTLDPGNTKYEFENLPKYASDSREYQYRVVETPIVGYTSSDNGSYNILNTYTPGETAVKVTKKWTNVDPNTDKVPEVKIILKQDGTEVDSIVLEKENEYTHTFANLDKFASTGVEYEYTVEEVLSDDVIGYTKKVTSGNDGFIVENIFDNTIIDINFTKVWENVSEASEVPEIKLYLYQNGVELKEKIVTLNGGLKEVRDEKYEYKGLPKYSTDGKEYVYTIKEDIISGYESSGEGNELNEYTITNKFIPGTVNVTGEKTWSGVENLSIVPTIRISLESSLDGEDWTVVENKTVELTAGNTKYEFDKLPQYSSNGKEYKYRVVESLVNGYDTSYDDEYNITNTYNPGEIAIRVTKKWTNVDPNTDKVPEVKIILKQDGTEVDSIVLDKENEYTHTFVNLDKYAPTGVEYEYTVEEVLSEGVVGYTKEITSGEEGFIVGNIFDRDATIDIPFIKVWENVTDNSRVPEIKLHLYQNGVELKEKVVTLKGGIKADRIESYVFKNLPKYATEGKEYVYTVIEDAVMGYTLSGEGNDANNYTITNTFTPESIDISGKKTWRSVSEEDLRKVPAIRVFLESSTDGIIWIPVEGKVLELTVGNTEYSFNNLPKYSEQGNKYKYRVLEDAVNGYETLYDLEYNITNTYNPGERSVKVTKNWRNVDPNTDKVPEVKIILKQSGTEVDSIVLDKENEYSHIFEGLAKYAPTGEEYVYTVEEVLGDNVVGYSKVITSGNDGFIIENTFDINAVADIIFNKVWRNIPKGSEVPSIKLHLYQNGVEMVGKYGIIDGGLKEDGKDKYVFKNLPKYSTDGKEYVYTIKEDSINGYTSSGEADESNNYTITNTYYGGEKVVISGKKTWVNVKDINKVPNITIRVLRDGKEIHSIVVPSGTTTYRIDLDSMVKYASDGHEYIYSLTEDKIEGFKSERDGYNFTNTNTIKEEVSSISEIKTGDNNKIFLYISLLCISISLGLTVTLRKRKKSLGK